MRQIGKKMTLMSSKTADQISYNMRQVKNKDSKIELALRKALYVRGIHYRKNVTSILGKPDIAFIGLKIAVFCDSEFWHGYNWDVRKNDFKTNREFWIPKIERNMSRDKEVTAQLESEGWVVIRFWGKEILADPDRCAQVIENTIKARKSQNV